MTVRCALAVAAWFTVLGACVDFRDAAAAGAPSSPSRADPHCEPRDGLDFICGPVGSEDLAHIPHTHWLIASGLNLGAPAHLYLIDTARRTAAIAFPHEASTRPVPVEHGACPGPPDPARMSMDGISLRPGRGGRHTVYAANHGDRIAIEIFDLDAHRKIPRLTWSGCLPLPPGLLANSVVPIENDGILVSSFHDPGDTDAWQRMDRGENTGSVWEWHPGTGFQQLDIGGVSGANGLEVSRDGGMLYVSAWSRRELLIVDRKTGARRRIPLDFLPDNIKRMHDGNLLVAGQRTTPAAIGACGAKCPQPWTVVRIDPLHDRVEPLLSRAGSELVNYACGALELEGTLYITVRGDRRLVTVAMQTLPSLR